MTAQPVTGEQIQTERYRYSILAKEAPLSDRLHFTCYGVEVVDCLTGKREAIEGFSTQREKVCQLADLLSRNQVSPIHLQVVIEDWMWEQNGRPYTFQGLK